MSILAEQIKRLQLGTTLTYEESFSMLNQCAALLTGDESSVGLARQMAIHILDNWSKIPVETHTIWLDIIESVGFYPYLSRNESELINKSIADEVRYVQHLSEYLPKTYLHSEQKKLSDLLLNGKNVIASAPTSFGKSLLIEEVVASRKYRNIVIIQPTLALLDETRVKLKKYSDDYKIIVRTSQAPADNRGNLFLLTAERVMEYNEFPAIDMLIIDEFYKLSLRRRDERSAILNNAFLKIVGKFHSAFYFLGPNIDGITDGFADKYDAIFYKSKFSLVDCAAIDCSSKYSKNADSKSHDKAMKQDLFALLDSLQDEQTIIYCSTPSRTRKLAREYSLHLEKNGNSSRAHLPIIEWINRVFNDTWSLAKTLSLGIAFHDGSLQKHIGASIIKYFNENKLRCIFCTATIIEGVNTSAKNVVIYDGKKGMSFLDFFDYSNIKGRSGRMMQHYVGRVFSFITEPQAESIIIDIPFFEQNATLLSDEILINIEADSVQAQVKDRYDALYLHDPNLIEILKKNGVNIEAQLEICNILERDINTNAYNNIAWTQVPSWNNLQYILTLAENRLFDYSSKHGVVSTKQLTYYIDTYRKKKNILDIAKDVFDGKRGVRKKKTTDTDQVDWDYAIETAFHIYRHWFQFAVPKAMRVIDSLQRYVCAKHNKKAGSYSYMVAQLENDFVRENLSILIEYGLPSDTVRRLERFIDADLDEDAVLEFIRTNKNMLSTQLLAYEIERLNEIL